MLAFLCWDGASNTDLARTGVCPATALDSSVRRSIVVSRSQARATPSGVGARRTLLNQKWYPLIQTKG